jgi:5'(3')-deoxyribonucleotidase
MRFLFDMDNVLCNYSKRFHELQSDVIIYPQSTYGFYTSLEPIEGMIELYHWVIKKGHQANIATRPSYLNPLCYTEKRVWVEKNMGLEAAKDMIIITDKSLIKADVLIDDNECPGFEGELMLFGSDKFPNHEYVRRHFYVKKWV